MSIRCAAKAIILHNEQILLNACKDPHNGEYYSLPGGGQHQYETLADALVRECREETGYTVSPVRFAALCEEICLDEEIRRTYPDYAHKMYHIFICSLASEAREKPTERDSMQVTCEWIALDSLGDIRLLPRTVGHHLVSLLRGDAPAFLGSEHIDFNHG